MAYFLKQTRRGSMVYLAIYESFWDPERKQPRNRCVKSLGSLRSNMEKGIADPIAYYKGVAAAMEEERKSGKKPEETKRIGPVSALRHLGYFPFHTILHALDVKETLDIFQSPRNFDFSVCECLSALLYAMAVKPASADKSFQEVICCLYGGDSFTAKQILGCLEFLGTNYDKFLELFVGRITRLYGLDTRTVLFTEADFCLDLDLEEGLPSKETSLLQNQDPIVRIGLLLSQTGIPIGMKWISGSEAERSKTSELVKRLKKRTILKGRVVQTGWKKIGCFDEIQQAIQQGDGYLFFRPLEKWSPEEKNRGVMKEEMWESFHQDSGRLQRHYQSYTDDFVYSTMDEIGRKQDHVVKEKRITLFDPQLKQTQIESEGSILLATSEIELPEEEICDVCRQVGHIEETFRTLSAEWKRELESFEKKEQVHGFFLLCALNILLERLFQLEVLENRFSQEEIRRFMKGFNVIEIQEKNFMNLAASGPVIEFLAEKLDLPLCNLELSEKEIERVLSQTA